MIRYVKVEPHCERSQIIRQDGWIGTSTGEIYGFIVRITL